MDARDEHFRKTLKNLVSRQVLLDEPAERHTSIGVGGMVDAIVYPQNRDELQQVVSYLGDCKVPFMPVGNWTNIIVKDGGYRGVVLSLQSLKHMTRTDRNANHVLIRADAGTPLADIVRLAAEHSLTGVEFCTGIPGSVGGAVIMNAGAYGNDIKGVIETVYIMDTNGTLSEHNREALHFQYRSLELPQETIITGATFLLTRGVKETIHHRIREILTMRKKKHPLEHRNAGSIFKNPQDQPAGQIIDALGLKGTRIGGAKISEKHGNFIVNTGNAKAADILALIDMVSKRVWEERGIHLEPEVRIIGEDR